MSLLSNIIKIDVYGQVDKDTKHIFTFPDTFNQAQATENDEWILNISEPRDARVFGVDEVYAYWKNRYGNYYSLIVPSETDSRGGLLMVTIFTDKYVVNNGFAVVYALQSLRPLTEEKRSIEEKTEIALQVANKLSTKLEKCDSKKKKKSDTFAKSYRIYHDNNDLADIFQFTEQPEYAGYDRLLIVPQNAITIGLPSNYHEIKNKIKKTFIVDSESLHDKGITVSKDKVLDGDTIDITYSKKGYKSITVSCLVQDGKYNKHFHFSGKNIIINSIEEADIKLQRCIKVKVQDAETLMNIPEFTVNYNQKKNYRCSEGKSMVIFPDSTNGEYKVSVIVPGYNQGKEKALTDDDFNKGFIVFKLYADYVEIPIQLEMSDSLSSIRDIVKVKANSKLLKYLRQADKENRSLNRCKFKLHDNSRRGGGKIVSKHQLKWIAAIFVIVAFVAVLFFVDHIPSPFSNRNPIKNDSVLPENSNDFSVQEVDELQKDRSYLKENKTWSTESLCTQHYKDSLETIANDMGKGDINKIIKINGWPQENKTWNGIVGILKDIKKNASKNGKAKQVMKECVEKDNEETKIKLSDLSRELGKIKNSSEEEDNKTIDNPRGGKTSTDKDNKEDGDSDTSGKPNSDNG